MERFHARRPIRTGSLIVTIFGDAVVPRGGALSLASLLQIMESFGIAEGPVRTALSRLVADGWFDRRKLGRHSFYQLTAHGRDTFDTAASRIYDGRDRDWSGELDLIVLDPATDRGACRTALEAAGCGAITQDLWVAPWKADLPELKLLRLTATLDSRAASHELGRRAWPLGPLAARYEAFMSDYGHVASVADALGSNAGAAALVLRILLIHDYRRIILRDPHLPAEFLPDPWPGALARALCGHTYRRLLAPSERWLDIHAAAEAGTLPPAAASLRRRFSAQM